ncbi:unnamed protein product [Orchesella dallaii]|uniref:Secreted protein n=1 Tax=Orchesella dallaii TaxID=48710 RepID=A0ABP1S788_9HEXA
MISSKSHGLLAIFVLFQFATCAFGLDSLAHFGDFMEFHIGLHDACANAPNRENITLEIGSSLAKCTHDVTKDGKDMFGTISVICNNRDKYFQCFDAMKMETLSKCGADKEQVLPVLYKNTVLTFCGSDNGAQKLADMEKAVQDTKPEDEVVCPESTAIPWLENCQATLPIFASPDLCKRHDAIANCIGRITCDNLTIGKLIKKMYTDGKSVLKC